MISDEDFESLEGTDDEKGVSMDSLVSDCPSPEAVLLPDEVDRSGFTEDTATANKQEVSLWIDEAGQGEEEKGLSLLHEEKHVCICQ